MEERFELTVEYKGEQLKFKASLIVSGYTHKFNVDVNGQKIIFEPDEEQSYRAIIPYEDIRETKSADIELLKQITKAIEGIGR